MIDLKEIAKNIIEQETEYEKTALLGNDWSDSISYYQQDIKREMMDYLEISADLADYILDNVHQWSDDIYQYMSSGFPHKKEGAFAIASGGEIEVDQDTLCEHYKLNTHKKSVRDAVNRYTDLYISDAGHAYINMDYDYIYLDFTKIDANEWREYFEDSKQ